MISLGYAIRTLLIEEYVVNLFFPMLPWEAVCRRNQIDIIFSRVQNR